MTWLHVTSVLYRNDVAAVDRLVTGVVRAAEVAREQKLFDRITYWIGDSSPLPVLDGADVEKFVTARQGGAVDEIEYRYYDANLGSAEGNNVLMRDVGADFFLMVNPDIYASPGLVVELAKPFADRSVGIVDARQLPFEHPKAYDPKTGETGWTSMACCMLRGEAVAKVGDLDSETFFLYCDDVDYAWRTRLAGYKLIHSLSAVAFHDKRLNAEARVAAGEAELYYAGEAALMLSYKYSREDITNHLLRQFEHGPPYHQQAWETFLRRKHEGRLPGQLDPEHKVAEFVDGNYARHRF